MGLVCPLIPFQFFKEILCNAAIKSVTLMSVSVSNKGISGSTKDAEPKCLNSIEDFKVNIKQITNGKSRDYLTLGGENFINKTENVRFVKKKDRKKRI